MKIEKLPTKLNKEDEEVIKLNLIKNIKLARLKTGLSQKEMGEMLGFKSGVALSLIESGERGLNADMLWKIAHITQEPIKNFYLQGLI
jgi:transcriptional regulator with XRE-family HTH domain